MMGNNVITYSNYATTINVNEMISHRHWNNYNT